MHPITLDGDFSRLRDELGEGWERCAAEHALSPALLPGWIASTAQARGGLEGLRVRALQRDGAVQALWPYADYRARMLGLPLRAREAPGRGLVFYHECCLPGADARANLAALMLENERAWDVAVFPAVVRGSPLADALADLAAERGWTVVRYAGEESPYVPIEGTWDAFLAAQSSNFRYNLKRKEKGLAKVGAVGERWFEKPEDVPALWSAMLAVETGSWKADRAMAISGSHVEQRYYEALLPFLAARGLMLANVIYVDDAPVAYSLCYRWRGRVAQMKTSFSERLSNLSPGLVVNARAIRRAYEEGAHEFDFLGDRLPHKMHWTDRVRAHDDHYVFGRSLRARLVGSLKRARQRLGRERTRFSTLGRGAQRAADVPPGE
jgi:CelD/BcsL family acetyltransferase involved in cellulose biosynthesis